MSAAQSGGPEGARAEIEVSASRGEGGRQCLCGGPLPRTRRPGWRQKGGGSGLLWRCLPGLDVPVDPVPFSVTF